MNKRTFWVPILIVLNAMVFLAWSSGGPLRQEFMQENFLVSWQSLAKGRWWTLLTSVFSHSLILHLLINMMVLRSFGQVLEQVLGRNVFIVFYLIAGIVSSFCHVLVSNFILGYPNMSALGASGAIAGVLMLFCLMFPNQKILLFAIIPLPAIWGALAFVAIDIWGVIAQSNGGGFPIGHGAHLGGALCGLIAYLTYFRKKRGQAPQLY